MQLTYSQLVTMMKQWPVDYSVEYSSAIPLLINLGQQRLVIDANVEIFDKTDASVSTVAGTRTIAKPSDCVSVRTVKIGSGLPLMRRAYGWCVTMFADASVRGTPEYFTDLNETQLYLVPTPAAAAAVTVRYIARPTDLSDSNTSNWLTKNFGHVLFAACLMEAEHYLKADDRYADMKNKYYQELLPTMRLEIRDLMRRGDYGPYAGAAKEAS